MKKKREGGRQTRKRQCRKVNDYPMHSGQEREKPGGAAKKKNIVMRPTVRSS